MLLAAMLHTFGVQVLLLQRRLQSEAPHSKVQGSRRVGFAVHVAEELIDASCSSRLTG